MTAQYELNSDAEILHYMHLKVCTLLQADYI